jgi:hypothetical protein
VVLLTAVALTCPLFFLLSCSDAPLGPETTLWEPATSLPEDLRFTGITAQNGGAIFISSSSYSSEVPSAIYKYENGALIEDFLVPENWSFNGISSYLGCVFAVGTKETSVSSPARAPYMMHNSGAGWVEIPVEVEQIDSLTDVFAINETDCWVLGLDAEDSHSVLIKYADGEWTRYDDDVNNVETAAYCPRSGVLYVACDYGVGEGPVWKLAITADSGVTWALEEIKLNTGSFEFRRLPLQYKAFYAVPGALFFTAEVWSGGEKYEGAIVKRTGAPGAGVYGLEFYSKTGSYFWDVRALAFKDEHNGMALGSETSIVYDDPDWVLEMVTGQDYFYAFDLAAVGPNGYWAITDPPGQLPPHLLYHP